MARKKQNLDMSKEDMYRKIMPSIPVPAPEEPEVEEPLASMEKDEGYEIASMPYNAMEIIVKTKMPLVINRLGACSCEQCRIDSMALALNKLPPVYCGSNREVSEQVRMIRSDLEVKVTSAIIQAVQSVMQNPRH